MKRTLLTVLAITGMIAACEPRQAQDSSESQEFAGGIVGGASAKEADVSPTGAASAVVAIEASLPDSRGLCTGTLIQPRIVLTAAHCLVEVTEASQLLVGLHALDLTTLPPPTAIFYSVERFVAHPGFKIKEGEYDQHNDLALLLLDRAVPATTKLAELPKLGFSLAGASELVTFGYGASDDRLNAEDEGTRVLRTTSFQKDSFGVFPFPNAPAGLPATDKYEGMIGSLAKTSSVCHGDSGGPLFVYENGTAILVGVSDMVLPAYFGQQGRDYEAAVKNGTITDFVQKYPDTRVCMGGWNVFVNVQSQLGWIGESANKLLKGR